MEEPLSQLDVGGGAKDIGGQQAGNNYSKLGNLSYLMSKLWRSPGPSVVVRGRAPWRCQDAHVNDIAEAVVRVLQLLVGIPSEKNKVF